jgi:nitrogen fixation/metabolism regulation signal transduction histidine kinase
MWRNLNLRTRIVLGYGLTTGLALALALALALWIGALNGEVKQLNTGATVEAATGARVTGQMATTQRLVERYLRQPRQENLQSAQFSLQELTAEIARARTTLAASPRQQRLDELEQRLAAYLTTFQSLSTLIQAQEPLRTSLNTHLARSSTLLKGALSGSLDAGADQAAIAPLIEAQASLQQANVWATRMTDEQSPTLGANALAELEKARGQLTGHPSPPGSAVEISIANTLNEIALATGDVAQLQQNLAQAQQQRDTQLDEQGRALRQQADTIAQDALDSLSAATTTLEGQTLQLQWIVFGALLLILLLVIAAGIWLDQVIARPLEQLIAAATRIEQGGVPQRRAGQISRLSALFDRLAEPPRTPDADAPPGRVPELPRPKTPRRDPGDDLLP